jgi:isopenicillin N synthase-like dioxygenase
MKQMPSEITVERARRVHDLVALGYLNLELPSQVHANILAAYANADIFFNLSPDERESNVLPFGCGYVPFGREHSGDATKPDHIEFFAVSARSNESTDSLPSLAARELHLKMMQVFDALERQTEDLVIDIASPLCGSESAQRLRGGLHRWSLLQMNQSLPTPPGELINTPHEDGHLLTLAHANSPGLEITIGGSFVPANRPATSMMVIPGRIITMLTGGQIAPLYHRVRAHLHSRPRLSLLFFANLDPALCIPWRRTAMNQEVDIGAHVLDNSARFGAVGFTVE